MNGEADNVDKPLMVLCGLSSHFMKNYFFLWMISSNFDPKQRMGKGRVEEDAGLTSHGTHSMYYPPVSCWKLKYGQNHLWHRSKISNSWIKTKFSSASYRQIHAVIRGICCLPQIDLEMSLKEYIPNSIQQIFTILPCVCNFWAGPRQATKGRVQRISSSVWGAASLPAI